MAWLTTLLIVVQVIAAIAVIVLVLLQHGKGADMGAAFGGGASGSLFGATGSANFLSRSTGVVATVFFLATLGLAYTSTEIKRPASDTGGVMGVPATTPTPVPAPTPKDIPTPSGQAPQSAPAAAVPAVPTPAAPTTDAAPKPSDIPQYLATSVESHSFHCPRGGIGRHTILRGWRRKPWEFESPRGHHVSKPHRDPRKLPSDFAVHTGRPCDRCGTDVDRRSARSAQP